jgi:uncharacterized protein (TIGR00251 family)
MHYIKKISDNEFIINLFIKPNSKNQQIFKPILGDDYITIALCSIPNKSKANVELLKLLKKKLRNKVDQILIISGHKNQVKSVKLTTFDSIIEEDIVKLLID